MAGAWQWTRAGRWKVQSSARGRGQRGWEGWKQLQREGIKASSSWRAAERVVGLVLNTFRGFGEGPGASQQELSFGSVEDGESDS